MLSSVNKLILLVILIYFANAQTSTPGIYTLSPHLRSGTWTAFSTLKTETDTIPSYTVVYTSTLVTINPEVNAITSVSSFDLLASTQFSFNTSLTSISYTGFVVKLYIFGNTYLNLIKFNYLGMSWGAGLQTKLLYYDCFLTNDLSIISTVKTQIFDKQKFANTIVDGSIFKVQSFITGMKFFNNKDSSKKVSVNSYIANSTDYITHSVSVTGNTILQWLCMGTVIIDTTYYLWSQQIIPFQIGSFLLDKPTASIDMTTFPSGYLSKYDEQDNKFFGLIEIQLSLGKPYQIIDFKSQNILAVEVGYQSLASGGRMGYIYYALRYCTDPTKQLYSLLDNLCWDICPGGQVKPITANICIACHYTCQTCTGSLQTECITCDGGTNHRTLVSANKTCPCQTGYVENNVALCPPCSSFIANCAQCSSKTICTKCSSTIFVFNATSIACQCAANTYYIAVDNVCASYPGCLDAQVLTNLILCQSCDASQHFYLDSSTFVCKCLQNYTQSDTTCVDFCGDGINTEGNSTTYCDDGNFINGDGCSSTCAIETGYGCFVPPGKTRSYCSGVKSIVLKYLWTQRVVNQNAGYFLFQVTPSDPLLSSSNFTYYIETTIPHTSGAGIYDPTTSILKIKIMYTQTIEDQSHTVKITLDPYVMAVKSQSFSLKSSGVNYDLTIDSQIPKFNNYIWYVITGVSGLIVIASVVFVFLSYKIAAVELLLSSQVVYMGVLASLHDNLALYPLTATKFLAGFNSLKQFEINKYNYQTPFVLSSNTFAQFLLNFNITPAILAVVIFIILPLKINLWFRTYQRTKFTSPQMQQKLLNQESTTSLKQMSTKIKQAQQIADIYIDKVYFSISLVAFLPTVLYFSIQLAFIGRIGRYELPSFANIILSILLLLVDFSFFILIFQDTDKKVKLFNFGSKKLKAYPNRLMMAYFCLVCAFTVVLLSDYTLYVLIGINIMLEVYVWVENPFERFSLEHIDSLSKPLISLICLLGIKAMGFFTTEIFFVPIIIISLMFISLIVSTIRTVRVKLARAQTAKRMLEEAEMDDQIDIEEKNLKDSTDGSQFDSQKNKKITGKFDDSKNIDKNIVGNSKANQLNEKGQQQDQNNSGEGLIKDQDPPYLDGQEIIDEDEDELTRIKRSLRQDLKKRRGIINKVNEDMSGVGMKKVKSRKTKTLSFGENAESKEHDR